MIAPTILLQSGAYFDFANPEASEFTIEDIAGALSRLCRFTGQTREFYSVAQHSVVVSRMLPDRLKLAGLLHDAHEAFVGDISTPLKGLLPDFRALEHRIQRVVLARFGLHHPLPLEVKHADECALLTEARDLLPPHDPWPAFAHMQPSLVPTYPLAPKTAEAHFMAAYRHLTSDAFKADMNARYSEW